MDDDDDFGDFGGFEAADPVETQEAATVTATPSPWAMFPAAVVQNTTEEPKVVQTAGAVNDEPNPPESVPENDALTTQTVEEVTAPEPRAEISAVTKTVETEHTMPVTSVQTSNNDTEIAWPTNPNTVQDSVSPMVSRTQRDRERDISEKFALGMPSTESSQQEVQFDQSQGKSSGFGDDEVSKVSNRETSTPTCGEDAVPSDQSATVTPVSEMKDAVLDTTAPVPVKHDVTPVPVLADGPAGDSHSSHTSAALQAVEAHRDNLIKELERMSSNQARWNRELEECKTQLLHQVERYDQLQVVHRNAVTEMRNAGHEALSVIVAEYKELSKTTLAHQREASQTELLAVMNEHSNGWQQHLKEQGEQMKAALAEQKSRMAEQLEEALREQREQLQEELQAALKEEREKHRAELEEALEAERENSRESLKDALQAERKRLRSVAQEDKVKLQSLVESERQKSTEAISTALGEERSRSQECIREALAEQRTEAARQGQKVTDEARREIAAYVERQKQADVAVRLRSLSAMDMFLEAARKQLDVLMQPPTSTANMEQQDKFLDDK